MGQLHKIHINMADFEKTSISFETPKCHNFSKFSGRTTQLLVFFKSIPNDVNIFFFLYPLEENMKILVPIWKKY